MSEDLSKAKRITRKINLVVWSTFVFFAIGYFPTRYLRPELAVMVTVAVAAMAVIPYASKLGKPLKSGLAAGVLGVVAGASMVSVMAAGPDIAIKYIAAVGGFCAFVGALFGHLAQQRRRQAEEEWEK